FAQSSPMSPKNKGKFGQGRPAVETTDEFVSGVTQVAEKLKPHTKLIAVVSAVLTLVLIGYYTYQYMDARAEAGATALYRQALELANRPIVPPAETPKAEAGATGVEGGVDGDDDSFPSHQA